MRLRSRRPPEPDTDSGDPDSSAAGLARVVEAIGALPLGIVIEDAERRTLVATERARNPIGEVQGDVLAASVLERVVVRAHLGEVVCETLELRGVPPRILEVSAQPLSMGGVLATIVDRSERHLLDAIRRDFVANVNHELRTPIGALSVLAEALQQEYEPETVQRLAGRIAVEADRATSLLGDLLDFSRVEESPPAQPEPLLITEVIATAADRVIALAERSKVSLSLPDVTEVPLIHGDRAQLVSAIANLLDNAVKYSDEGTEVSVEVHVEADHLAVAVADRGVGIPARDLDRIFERFYRVDRARDRRTGGSGLGLAIVRHVASNHGGDVSVASQEGMGSTFTLQLPLPLVEL